MKRVLLVLGILLSSLSVFANDNVLQSIEIEPVKDTYNIVLVSDKAVDVKKTVQASNKITLTMKDIRASKTLNTVYNNVSNVDSIMVEPQGNGLSIFFQADNASAATISFDALAAIAPAKKSTQNIKLNNPIESYAPIYNETFEDTKTSNLFDKLKSSSTVASIKDSIDEETVSNTANKAFSFGLIALLGFAVIRLFKRREPEMKIGLSQSLNEREIAMHRGVQTVPQSYMEKPFTSVNYGLNAYQRESQNPYEEQEAMHFHNPRLRSYVSPAPRSESATQTISRPQPQVSTVTQPQVKKMTTPVNTAPVNQGNPNIDNLKFLESMTAIYEKSGRHDLARGLKASLSKNIK